MPIHLRQNRSVFEFRARRLLGTCRTWGVDSENLPQRGQFLSDLRTHSPIVGQKDAVLKERRSQKWTASVDLQPTIPTSDKLLGSGLRWASWLDEAAARRKSDALPTM